MYEVVVFMNWSLWMALKLPSLYGGSSRLPLELTTLSMFLAVLVYNWLFKNSSLLTVSSNRSSRSLGPPEWRSWFLSSDLLKFFIAGDYVCFITMLFGDLSTRFDVWSCWYLLLRGPNTLFKLLTPDCLPCSNIFLLRKFWCTGRWLISIRIC